MSEGKENLSSAPGKLFLSGEYAVLKGAPAVVAAVDVRAYAWTCRDEDDPPGDSVFLREAREAVAKHLAGSDGGALDAAAKARADSSGFSKDGRKMGLGSSAAVTVAAVHALLCAASDPNRSDRQLVAKLAGAAHRAAQGGRGSGADVAAAALGGVIRFQGGQGRALDEKLCVEVVAIASGKAASTVDLVRRVEELARREPSLHGDLMREMEALSQELVGAHERGDAADVVRLSRIYGDLMDRLGRAAKVAICAPAHRRAMDLAERFGGAAKPSGAGGGDFAVALFEDPRQADAFRGAATDEGLEIPSLLFGASGVRVEAPARREA